MKLTTKQDIETGVLIALVSSLWAWWQLDWTFVLITTITLAISLILPVIFRPIAYLWFGLARFLGFVVPMILLAVLFYLLVIPVGIVRKWLGKDSLQLNNFNKEQNSILKNRNYTYQPDDLKNPF